MVAETKKPPSGRRPWQTATSNWVIDWVILGQKMAILNSKLPDLVREGGLCGAFRNAVHSSPPRPAARCTFAQLFWDQFTVVRRNVPSVAVIAPKFAPTPEQDHLACYVTKGVWPSKRIARDASRLAPSISGGKLADLFHSHSAALTRAQDGQAYE